MVVDRFLGDLIAGTATELLRGLGFWLADSWIGARGPPPGSTELSCPAYPECAACPACPEVTLKGELTVVIGLVIVAGQLFFLLGFCVGRCSAPRSAQATVRPLRAVPDDRVLLNAGSVLRG